MSVLLIFSVQITSVAALDSLEVYSWSGQHAFLAIIIIIWLAIIAYCIILVKRAKWEQPVDDIEISNMQIVDVSSVRMKEPLTPIEFLK